jgi:predicted glycoside hydrolase/deacetylase ChbG (UPF0249 family)
MVRCDDIGLNGSVNRALESALAAGIPVSASVLAVAPAFPEAVELLKRHPEAAVGLHLALNAEWLDPRWGPAAGAAAVPSLVDPAGRFWPSAAATMAAGPTAADVETELRAQVAKARAAGLRIDYLDTHMGTIGDNYAFADIVRRLSAELGVPIAFASGERYVDLYGVEPAQKTARLAAAVRALVPGGPPSLVVCHLMADEAAAPDLVLAAPSGRSERAHRAAELAALLSPEFAAAVAATGARLVTYRDFPAPR